jgi:hypothetical protein
VVRRRDPRPPRPAAESDPPPDLGARRRRRARLGRDAQSPHESAHLERTPYLSCTYWDATHDVAIADCHASWEKDRDEHARVWALYAAAPEPLGYDFHAIWPDGPLAEGAALLALDPWRLHVADALTVMTPRVWKPDTAYR